MGIFEALWKFWIYTIITCICGIWVCLYGLNMDNPAILALLSVPFLVIFSAVIGVKLIFGEAKALLHWIGRIFS